MSRIYLLFGGSLIGSFLLLSLSAGAAGVGQGPGLNATLKSTTPGGGIAFCCGSRVARSETGFRGTDCVVIANDPRSINSCLNGELGGPGDISAGCLSGMWSCEPFVDSNGNIVKNCCCEPPVGQGTGTCLNDIP